MNTDPFNASEWGDVDNDGFGDNEDQCRFEPGTIVDGADRGCPDRDGDGVADRSDDLPDDNNQWLDTDNDGFGENTASAPFDDCPAEFGSSNLGGLFGCPDSDGDGWTDCQEAFIGTDPLNFGTPAGWPPDPAPIPDGNCLVQIDDVSFAAGRFGAQTGDAAYTPRAEIASQNGVVQIDDVVAFTNRFGQSC